MSNSTRASISRACFRFAPEKIQGIAHGGQAEEGFQVVAVSRGQAPVHPGRPGGRRGFPGRKGIMVPGDLMDNAEQPVGDARGNGAGAKLLIQAAAGGLRGLAPHLRVRGGQLHRQPHQPLQTGMALRKHGHGAYGFLRLLHVEAGNSATGLP